MPRKLTQEEFIEKSKLIHRNKYDYSNSVYVHAHEKIKIICPKHGEFLQKPNGHFNGKGCLKCSGKAELSTLEFIERAKLAHGDKYDYSLVDYKKTNKKIKIICSKHGEFMQTPNSHISAKNGCMQCGGKSKITIDVLKSKAKKIHGDKYDYSLISEIKNNSTKIKILCLEHGEFMQTPDAHLNQKQGCPSCCESKGERIVANFLKENKLSFDRQKTFDGCENPKTGRKLKFDFYLPKLNMCIEYDGRQHFEPIKRFGGRKGYNSTIYRDEIKNEFCAYNNIKIVRIKYNEIIINKLKRTVNECI